jgi:fibronectin-binding autotransporter adhesin
MVINNAYVAVGKLTMSGGVITINNGMTMALHGDPTAGPNQGFISVPASANPSVINGPGGLYLRNSFGANKTFDVGGSLVINAPISSQGAVTLTKSGAGTLVIGNTASRVSSAVVSGGILQTPAPAMTGPVTLQNDANITFDGAGSFDQGIAGAGSVAKIGSGELVVGGQNSYTGATAINAGTLTLSRLVAGVVAHLAFDETAGTTAQNSANPSLNGTISASGVAVNQPGKVGAAYQFTASSDGQVVVPTDASLNSATGTWSMWINTSLPLAGPGSDEAAMLIDRRAATGNIWGINSSGHLYIQTSGGAARFAGNTNVADGQWHQVMLTWNTAAGSDQTYYVDGVADGTQTAGAAWGFDNRQLEIGKSHDDYWKRFNGLMDDVYVFNRALSADEAGLFYSVSSGTVASVDYLPDASAVAVAAGATLNVNGLAETIGPLSGQGAVTLGGGALTINSSDGTNGVDSVFAGSVTGAGNLVKIGAGKLTLAGPNSYVGGTLVQAGVLEIAASDALPNGGALTIGADGPLALAGGATAAAGSSMAGTAVTQAASPAAVPEPGTMLLLAAGALAALAMGLRRKFR